MKYLIILLFSLVLVVLGVAYVFTPSSVKVLETTEISVNEKAAIRFFDKQENWKKWQLDKPAVNDSKQTKSARKYLLGSRFFESIEVRIIENDDTTNSTLRFFPVSHVTSRLQWETTIETGSDPLTRLSNFGKAKEIKRELALIKRRLESILENEENIYGINIHSETVKDTMLAAIKTITDNYPTTVAIYGLAEKIKNHLAAEGVTTNGHPMLHVQPATGERFETMVALPISKRIGDKNGILFKRMVPGKILVTEIRGGTETAKQAWMEMEHFVQDHRVVSPAIPFFSLVTNRLREKDSSRWITRICYPAL